MKREILDKNILKNFAINFCKIVEKYTEYIIVSGFVAIVSGRVRGTEDIDLFIKLIPKENFLELHRDLVENDFECMQSNDPEVIYNSYLKENLSVRYTYNDMPLPEMEVKFPADELDVYQFKIKTKLPKTGLDLWFSSINMNIAFKEEYLKSEKDIEDAVYLRKFYQDLINENEINKFKQMIRNYKLK